MSEAASAVVRPAAETSAAVVTVDAGCANADVLLEDRNAATFEPHEVVGPIAAGVVIGGLFDVPSIAEFVAVVPAGELVRSADGKEAFPVAYHTHYYRHDRHYV